MEPYSNSAPAEPPAVLDAPLPDGRRLPIIDIGHPAFAVSVSDAELEAQAETYERESGPLRELPPDMRAALAQSTLGAAVMRSSGTYLAGLPTYVFKLGPEHLGAFDSPLGRRLAASFPALTLRIRLQDVVYQLAGGLRAALRDGDESRPLLLVNIAGGAAADSWNTLMHLRREQPGCLDARPIAIAVLDGDGDAPAFGAAAVDALKRPGAPPDDAEKRVLPGGRTAMVFVWVTVRQGTVPAALTHRFALKLANPDATPASQPSVTRVTDESAISVRGVDVSVSTKVPRVVAPPLEGDHWLAANGPGNEPDHRRTLLSLNGEGRIAQRFAIDWVRLFEDGRTFRGDPQSNASYRAFGANALAVADAIVVETLDGLPENVPDPVARAVPITPTTISGNYILLELGDGEYAVYAHLQPGSLRVKKGDRVRRRQILALVGNTGNSSEPHLHFHIADRPRAIDAEGVPYAFASFRLEAEPEVVTPALRPLGGSLEIGPSGLARWKAAPPQRREREIPLQNAIVAFPDR